MAERDEQALRDALRALGPDEPVDPAAARQRAGERRRNGRMAVGIAVALVLVAGVIGVPRLLPAEQTQSTSAGGAGAEAAPSAESAPDDRAPARSRTEYYRDISFQVPEDWGYAVPPQSDWCADKPRGQPRADQRRPYVWLASAIPVRAIGCPVRPASLLTEHVEALAPGPAVDYAEGAIKEGDWWVVTRFAGSAVLVVTTKQRALAEQILASAEVEPEDAPCPPASPVVGPLGTRPENVTDLTLLPPVDWTLLCQYEPVVDPADAELPRLRATVRLTGSEAQALVSDLAAAPVNRSSCDPAPLDGLPELALLVRVGTGDQTSDIHIAANGCPDSDSGMAGGIDDGTTLRLLTRDACRQVLTPPIAVFSGSGDVGRNCVGVR
jgi:hypothetical protein